MHCARNQSSILILVTLLAMAGCGRQRTAEVNGWLSWRGPGQDGHSPEKSLPGTWQPGDSGQLWEVAIRGRGAPVISGDRLFCIHASSPTDESLVCIEARNGRELWRTDLAALAGNAPQVPNPIRGGPAIDPESGNVCAIGSTGLLAMFSPAGEPIWRRPLAELHGWITSPHGPPAPAIDGDLVIVHGLTAGWGEESEPSDRFLAFDRRSGEHLWTSSPGITSRTGSASSPVFEWRANRRILYCGTGCGHLVAIDARSGLPLWRKRLSSQPLQASPLLAERDTLVTAVCDTPEGRPTESLVALSLAQAPSPDAGPPEVWRAHASKIDADSPAARAVPWPNPAASPVASDGIIWHRGLDGIARAFSPKDGRQTRQARLGAAWPAAPPTIADNKLFSPVGQREFAIADLARDVTPARAKLDGAPSGAPAVYRGHVFVLTGQRLYCFGSRGGTRSTVPPWPRRGAAGEIGGPARLQFVPGELQFSPGEVRRVHSRALDANGNTYADGIKTFWQPAGPGDPAAVPVRISDEGEATAPSGAGAWSGIFEASSGDTKGSLRVRLVPKITCSENFDRSPSTGAPQIPLSWIASRGTWDGRDVAGRRVLCASPKEGERAIAFFGDPNSTADTLAASIMAHDTRRIDARAGLTLRRYSLTLDGNWQRLEIAGTRKESNPAIDFAWQPNTWYRLRIQIEAQPQGATFVRARAWPAETQEPHSWLIEAIDVSGHSDGAPGLSAAATSPAGAQVLFDDIALGLNP